MRALVNDRCSHPRIRTLAASIVGQTGNVGQQIAKIRSWLTSHVYFLPDPDTTELLHDPVLLAEWIEHGGTVGVDCDDVAMLGAAIGKAIGIPARFAVVAFYEPNAPFGHVWAELFDGGTWRELDTTRRVQGVEDSRVTRRAVVDVATGERGEHMPVLNQVRRVGAFPAGRRNGLGWVQSIPVVVSTIQTITSLFQGGKEVDRIKQNEAAESIALGGGAGAPTATEFLKCRSGEFGICTITGYPDEIGGWATQSAQDDAARRYRNVVQQHGGEPGTVGGGTVSVTTPFGSGAVNNSTLLLGGGLLALFLLRKR
jgi:hypothetical protein